MAKLKTWEIPALEDQKSFCEAGNVILKSRIDFLLSCIDEYFKNRTVENLHSIRIALRRVRYNMELFISCFERKLFFRLYKKVGTLQDLSGLARDLDVFKANIKSLIENEKVRINRSLINNVVNKRLILENNLEIELMKFLHSKSLKDFYKLLS